MNSREQYKFVQICVNARISTKTKKMIDLVESGMLFNADNYMENWKGNDAKNLHMQRSHLQLSSKQLTTPQRMDLIFLDQHATKSIQ